MVSTINTTLDDDEADRIKDVKGELGLTWPEFLSEATDAIAEREGLE